MCIRQLTEKARVESFVWRSWFFVRVEIQSIDRAKTHRLVATVMYEKEGFTRFPRTSEHEMMTKWCQSFLMLRFSGKEG